MKPFVSKAAVVALVMWSAFAGNAFAWGQDGHRAVCRIAYLLLDEAQQKEVTRLTAAYRRPDGKPIDSFPDACIFPDEARSNAVKELPDWTRFKQFNNWHFLNVPRTRLFIDPADCANDCVLDAIAFHSAALHAATTDQERAEALFFLGHWVGDIHQPLHVSYADDLGGNNVKPIEGGYYSQPTDQFPTNLHSVWDSKIIIKAEGNSGWREYADMLEQQITPPEQALWLRAEPLEWAQESYVLTTSPAMVYCEWEPVGEGLACNAKPQTRTLTAPYQTMFQDDVETRLQQAGVRLAERIRRNLGVE